MALGLGEEPFLVDQALKAVRVSIVAGGSSSSGGPVTVADGADVTLGAIADAKVVTDIQGTISGKLRGIVSLLAGILTVKTDQTTHGTTDKVAADVYVGGVVGSAANPLPTALPACWAITGDSGANAAQTLTRAADGTKSHYIQAFEVAISAAAAGADIAVTLKDGSTAIWKTIIGNAAARGERVGVVFSHPVQLTSGNAANLVVDAGGASVVTSANLSGYTR